MSNITKDFSGVKVLDNVSFELNRGDVHVLAGENGAGKSTLMKILSGVHTVYSGTIKLEGRVIRFSSPHDAVKNGIAIIHQELSLVHAMSVVDNLFLARENTRGGIWLKKKEQENLAREILRRLDLEIDVQKPVGEFLPSVRQLIEIARALAMDARVLIMDEPTSSLNETESRRLFGLIDEIKKSCGIVYISHKMDEIYRLADHITVLRDGKHIVSERAGKLSREELVRKLVGRELAEQFPVCESKAGDVVIDAKNFSVPQPAGSALTSVRDVTFSVRAGEIVGVAGVYGSGNSELLHGLFGSYGSVSGTVTLGETRYEPRSPGHAIRSGLALLTNDRNVDGLVSGMNVANNITLASLKNVFPNGWMREQREKELARGYQKDLSIKMASVSQDIRELSGGNQQKVVLAKWVETAPRVLLLDEPTRGVDVGAKHEIYQWMNHWKSKGVAILLITSELSEMLALADRIYVMQRGSMTAEYSGEEATRENIIQAAMV